MLPDNREFESDETHEMCRHEIQRLTADNAELLYTLKRAAEGKPGWHQRAVDLVAQEHPGEAVSKELAETRDRVVALKSDLHDHAIEWLAKELGDVHIEYMHGDGWGVLTCHDRESKNGTGWSGRISGRTLAIALRRAVLRVKAGQESSEPLG